MWLGEFELKCYNNGILKWEESFHNALCDQGEEQILDVYLRGAAAPASFYLGLTASALTDTSTLSAITEPSGGGYARALVNRDATASGWPILALDAGDFMATSKTVTFTATATWISVDKCFMATTINNTGKLVSFGALSAARVLINSDVLEVTYKVKLA